MSVFVPYNKPGNVTMSNYEHYSIKRTYKRNNTGKHWEDKPIEYSGHYPNWSSEKSTTVKTTPDATGFRKPTSYERKCTSWFYTPSEKTTAWTNTGGPKGEQKYTSWQGFNCGSVHFGDIDLPAINHPERSNLSNRAQMEAMAKLQEERVNLGAFLAEVRGSADTIADTSIDLLNALRDVRRGRMPRNLGNLKFGTVRKMSDLWLNWRYGWRPLCSDLYGMTMDLVNTPPREERISVSRTVTHSLSGDGVKYGIPFEWDASMHSTCKLWATVDSHLLRTGNGYGLVNPLSLAWEVIPYSFVVDWFLPIGTTLASISAPSGLSFKAGFYNSRVEGSCNFPLTNCGHSTRKVSHFQRTKLSNFPRPKVYAVQSPFFNRDTSLKTARVLDMLSLMNTVKRK